MIEIFKTKFKPPKNKPMIVKGGKQLGLSLLKVVHLTPLFNSKDANSIQMICFHY